MKNRHEIKNKRLKYLRKLSKVRPNFHKEAGQLEWEDFIIELGKHGCFQSPVTFDNLLARVKQTKNEYRKVLTKECGVRMEDLGDFAPRFRSSALERARGMIQWAIEEDILFFYQTISQREELFDYLIEHDLMSSNKPLLSSRLSAIQKSSMIMRVSSYYPWISETHYCQKSTKDDAIQSLGIAKELFIQYPDVKNPWSPLNRDEGKEDSKEDSGDNKTKIVFVPSINCITVSV